MKNLSYLAAAYMFIWGGLFLYIMIVAGQQKKLLQKVEMLDELLKKGDTQ